MKKKLMPADIVCSKLNGNEIWHIRYYVIEIFTSRQVCMDRYFIFKTILYLAQ